MQWYHGSRHKDPIQKFKHGEHPATAGWAGFGSYQVDRHAFFFSHDPRMSAQFGHVHAYEITPRKILDLCNDIKDEDVPILDAAGLSVRGIDNLHDKWELFDGEGALDFTTTLQKIGYDAVLYFESDAHQVGRPCLAVLTPDVIRPANVPVSVITRQSLLWSTYDALSDVFKQYQGQLTTPQLHEKLCNTAQKSGIHIDPQPMARALLLRQWDVVMDKLSYWNPLPAAPAETPEQSREMERISQPSFRLSR